MVAVYYDSRVTLRDIPTTFPVQKFAAVHADWSKRFAGHAHFAAPAQATIAQLERVHDSEYVAGVLDGSKKNGFGSYALEIGEAALWDVGGFIAAARHAAKTKENAVSIGGGFHHASFDSCHGFCTFNGLMVAAMDLRKAGFRAKIGILDLDGHFGDGTQLIIDQMGLQEQVLHYIFAHELLGPEDVEGWLKQLPFIIANMYKSGVRVLFFNAGVDTHRDDPMTKGILSTAQMQRRENIVFGVARKLGLPVAWTLAGGYGKQLPRLVALHGLAMEASIRHEQAARVSAAG